MEVVFETGDGRSFEEEIWFFSPVSEIKEKLHKHHGFPISRQTLLFNGKIMDDERDTEYYNVLEGSRIVLCLAPESEQEPKADPPKPSISRGKRVKVTMLVPMAGNRIRRAEAEVNLADNVSELRKELWRMKEQIHGFYLPVEGFFFIYNQNVMEEERTFRWHGVQSGDVIEVFTGSVTGGS